jgi:hypothetical protein
MQDEALGDHLADAARSAGDQGHAAFEREHIRAHAFEAFRFLGSRRPAF